MFLPGLVEISGLSTTMFISLATLLVIAYYLKTEGSPKQVMFFYTLATGLGLGFPIFAVFPLVFNAVAGCTIQGINLLLDYLFSYTLAFVTAIPVSKKMQNRRPGRLS